jgi:predicted O-methyltransferase YrrM
LNRQKHHLVKPSVWDWWGFDLIALAHYKLGNYAEAITYGKKALSGAIDNTRLQKNLQFYEQDFDASQIRESSNEIKEITEYPDWFSRSAKNNFERFLLPFAGHENFKGLQLGVFTGDASLWLLENVLTNKNSSLTDVDTWEGSQEAAYTKIDVEGTFSEYLGKISHHRERIEIFRCSTLDFLRTQYSLQADNSQYDFVYIDADHTTVGVLVDAVLSWPLLKAGGLLAFDDYTWHHETRNPILEPKKGVDLFLEHYRNEYELLVINWQVWIQKK